MSFRSLMRVFLCRQCSDVNGCKKRGVYEAVFFNGRLLWGAEAILIFSAVGLQRVQEQL